MRRATSILRKYRASDKVYVPKDARDNQYIIAEMPLTDALLKSVAGDIDLSSDKPYQRFYQKLAQLTFELVEDHGIEQANLVANNRLVRVRYSNERLVLHTQQQSYFFYNPLHNSTFKAYYDGAERSNKVKFLFLATGDELRLNSANFHKKVYAAVQDLAQRLGLNKGELKLKDHQHLTYDVFAKEKGNRDTITHSFREISDRYNRQGYEIQEPHTAVNYAIVSMPMARRLLKGTNIDYEQALPFEPLYTKLEQAFKTAAQSNQIKHAAMIANGLSTFVRYDEAEENRINGELISLGFNPNKQDVNINAQWQGDKLVDNIRLVFFADTKDEAHNSYGKFVNQVTQAIHDFAQQVDWKKDKDDMIMRMHQHIIRHI